MKVTSKTALLIFVATLLIVGLVIYYFFTLLQSGNEADNAANDEPKTNTTTQETSIEATEPIEKAYKAYLAGLKADKKEQALDDFKRASEDGLASTLDKTANSDPILCTQNIPNSLKFTQPVVMGNSAIVTVTAVFEGGSSKIVVNSDTKTDKITSITCQSAPKRSTASDGSLLP